jgi:hypothetical protein
MDANITHTPLFDGYFDRIYLRRFISSQLFRAMGYRVTAIKIDPYLNVDAGTMVRMIPSSIFRSSNSFRHQISLNR